MFTTTISAFDSESAEGLSSAFLDVFNGSTYGSMGTIGADIFVADFAEEFTELITFSHASMRSEGLVILVKC